MRNDENSVVFGDFRSDAYAASATPGGPPGDPAAVREGRLKGRDELAREVEVLGERIATVSAAVLRLGSSLDLATVLQEAAESARRLTHARDSLIVTVARRASSSRPGGGASAQAGEHRKSRTAARVRPGVRHYPDMQSARACMMGRRFSSGSSRAQAATVAEPSTCASANSDSSSSTSCCRAQSLKLRPRAKKRLQLSDTKHFIPFGAKPFPTNLPTWTDWRSMGESELVRGRVRRRAKGGGHQSDLGHPRCVGCENHAPKGVLIAFPDRSNRREMKAVVQPVFGPSGA